MSSYVCGGVASPGNDPKTTSGGWTGRYKNIDPSLLRKYQEQNYPRTKRQTSIVHTYIYICYYYCYQWFTIYYCVAVRNCTLSRVRVSIIEHIMEKIQKIVYDPQINMYPLLVCCAYCVTFGRDRPHKNIVLIVLRLTTCTSTRISVVTSFCILV